MPPKGSKKSDRLSLTQVSINKLDKNKTRRSTLTELSQNMKSEQDKKQEIGLPLRSRGFLDGEVTLRLTPELKSRLDKDKQNVKEFLNKKLDSSGHLEIFGFSRGKYIPNTLYDTLFTSDFKVKKLALRSRGNWDSCHCPKEKRSNTGEQIDTIGSENITNLEHISVFRPFCISSCALLDLISRSPKLKTLRFYGVLTSTDHFTLFREVRFLSELEGVYWPWCNRELHGPTLKTILERNDSITTLYCGCEVTCSLSGNDLLSKIKYLSLVMNEDWSCKPGKTKKHTRRLSRINNLSLMTKIEAIELRTFDISLDDEEGDPETNNTVKQIYESYLLALWENIAKLPHLKYLAIYGSWDLDKVARELSRHGIQIEYLKTNLMPNPFNAAIAACEDLLSLTLGNSVKQLVKLAKLKSIDLTCHENLNNIDTKTVSSLKEVSDLIWRFDFKSKFTNEVEELLTNTLRSGNQHGGKAYQIKVLVETDDGCANFCFETIEKFSSNTSIRERLNSLAQAEYRERFGKPFGGNIFIWGFEQAAGRDKVSLDQLKSVWNFYNNKFRPVDMYM